MSSDMHIHPILMLSPSLFPRLLEEGEFSTNIEGIYLTGFRRSLRLCRRQSLSTGSSQQSFYTRSGYNALNNPYEEVVRYQRNPQDKHRLVALVGKTPVRH